MRVLKIGAVAVLSTLGSVFPSSASEQDKGYQLGSFLCLKPEVLTDHTISAGDVRVNNFSVVEEKSPMHGGLNALTVTFSVANRGEESFHITGQFLFMSDGIPVAALTAKPTYSVVNSGKTTTAEGTVFVEDETMPAVSAICLRMTGA